MASNYRTCSRPTAPPSVPGRKSGSWCRFAPPSAGAALIEIRFLIETLPDHVLIRRVLVREVEQLPPWASKPSDWPDAEPWPVVDL